MNRRTIGWYQKFRKRPAAPRQPRPQIQQYLDPNGRCYCPVCCNRLARFLPAGNPPRSNAKCPACGALERHRAAWVYLEQTAGWLKPGKSRPDTSRIMLLHIAPEAPLEKKFRQLKHVEYLSADLQPGRAMIAMDLTATQLPSDQFDVIFCSHVLEHIEDDLSAMREMARILKPDGVAYIQVPLRPGKTYEDQSIKTPEGRLAAFGQADHVRIYGHDIVDRLENSGFRAEIRRPGIDEHQVPTVDSATYARPVVVCYQNPAIT